MSLFSFFKKDFVKNVMILITGSGISQVILYLSILWLTRLFSTEAFGIYMLFSSAILVLKPIVSLQLELAVVLPKRDKDAVNIFTLSILTLLGLNLVLFLFILLFKPYILVFFKIEELSFFIYLIPISTLLFGCITTLDYWNNRTKKFKKMANGKIIKASFMSATQIGTGLSNFKTFGLIPGVIIGQVAQFLFLFTSSFQSIVQHKKHISLKRMFFLVKKYKDIPFFNTLINFSNTLSNEIPVLLISKYFGLGYAGIYGLAIKVGRAPSGVIQEPISQVFFNKATEIYNKNENLYVIVKKTFRQLLKIGLSIFTVLFIISFLLDFVFGKNWTDVGLYLRILIPWLFLMFLASPLTPLILILNKQKVILLYDILLLTFRFLSLYIGYVIFNDVIISLILFSGTGVIFNIFILIYFFQISKKATAKQSTYQ